MHAHTFTDPSQLWLSPHCWRLAVRAAWTGSWSRLVLSWAILPMSLRCVYAHTRMCIYPHITYTVYLRYTHIQIIELVFNVWKNCAVLLIFLVCTCIWQHFWSACISCTCLYVRACASTLVYAYIKDCMHVPLMHRLYSVYFIVFVSCMPHILHPKHVFLREKQSTSIML